MTLQEEFEKEKGLEAYSYDGRSVNPTPDFIKWLESKLIEARGAIDNNLSMLKAKDELIVKERQKREEVEAKLKAIEDALLSDEEAMLAPFKSTSINCEDNMEVDVYSRGVIHQRNLIQKELKK